MWSPIMQSTLTGCFYIWKSKKYCLTPKHAVKFGWCFLVVSTLKESNLTVALVFDNLATQFDYDYGCWPLQSKLIMVVGKYYPLGTQLYSQPLVHFMPNHAFQVWLFCTTKQPIFDHQTCIPIWVIICATKQPLFWPPIIQSNLGVGFGSWYHQATQMVSFSTGIQFVCGSCCLQAAQIDLEFYYHPKKSNLLVAFAAPKESNLIVVGAHHPKISNLVVGSGLFRSYHMIILYGGLWYCTLVSLSNPIWFCALLPPQPFPFDCELCHCHKETIWVWLCFAQAIYFVGG